VGLWGSSEKGHQQTQKGSKNNEPALATQRPPPCCQVPRCEARSKALVSPQQHPLGVELRQGQCRMAAPARHTGKGRIFFFWLLGAPRTEGPLHLNSGEEPLQHEAGAEGLSTPALNPCGTHRGARVQLWEQAREGGKGSPTGSLTGTPTRGHALVHWASRGRPRAHEAVQRSKAVDGSGGGGGGETQTGRLLFWF
jgi:hypothetical protein